MSKVYENIVNENEHLKLVRTLDEIFEEIQEYLKNEFKIADIAITLINLEEGIEETLYQSKEKLTENEHYIFELHQSNHNKIKIVVSTNDESFMNKNKFLINLALQAFSQTLYNKFLKNTLDDLTLIDSVTGLYNRHYLDNYSNKILSLASREEKNIGFIKVGIDQFKAVIDEFDYIVGDKVLKTLSKVLKQSVRTSDIVIKIDADEFLVILMNIVKEDNAIMIAEKFISKFAQESTVVNEQTQQKLKKSICCGVAIFPEDASSIEEIVRKSDIALYEARNLGRSKVFKYTQEDTNTIDFF